MDENTLEFAFGYAFLILLFLGFYVVTRLMAWLQRLLEKRRQ